MLKYCPKLQSAVSGKSKKDYKFAFVCEDSQHKSQPLHDLKCPSHMLAYCPVCSRFEMCKCSIKTFVRRVIAEFTLCAPTTFSGSLKYMTSYTALRNSC